MPEGVFRTHTSTWENLATICFFDCSLLRLRQRKRKAGCCLGFTYYSAKKSDRQRFCREMHVGEEDPLTGTYTVPRRTNDKNTYLPMHR